MECNSIYIIQLRKTVIHVERMYEGHIPPKECYTGDVLVEYVDQEMIQRIQSSGDLRHESNLTNIAGNLWFKLRLNLF